MSGNDNVESELEAKYIKNAINNFLWQQTAEKRDVFIRRYWYFDSVETICQNTGFSQSKVKSMLYGLRQKLKKYLESEGITI